MWFLKEKKKLSVNSPLDDPLKYLESGRETTEGGGVREKSGAFRASLLLLARPPQH